MNTAGNTASRTSPLRTRRGRGVARIVLMASAVGLGIGMGLGLAGCASDSGGSRANTPVATGQYAFWPVFPAEPRVQFVRAIESSNDLSPTSAGGLEKLVFGKENANDSKSVYKPYGVEWRHGCVYVCDMRNSCLTVLDIAKKQTRLVGVAGINRLSHPVDVAVADDGMIYVADNERGAVVVFDANERYAKAIGHEGMKPVSLAVHGDKLYVCEMTSQSVEVFDRKTGNKTGKIGAVGDGDGQFRLPLGVDTDKAGNVYVVDMMRCRVQKFGPNGTFISGYGQLGDYAGSFARPKHIAVDSDGIQYVVDASFQNVQMFDDQSRLLMSFGAAGSFPGAMDLPVGICVSDENVELFKDLVHPGFEAKRVVVVTNQFGPGKVSIYVMGERRPTFALADMATASSTVSSGTVDAKGPRDLQMTADDQSTLGPEPGVETEEKNEGDKGEENGAPKPK